MVTNRDFIDLMRSMCDMYDKSTFSMEPILARAMISILKSWIAKLSARAQLD